MIVLALAGLAGRLVARVDVEKPAFVFYRRTQATQGNPGRYRLRSWGVGDCPGFGSGCRQLFGAGLGDADDHHLIGRGPSHFTNALLGIRSDG